jgi:hypothetical protein
MRASRFYASHRRAWTPRLWPILIADAIAIIAIGTWVQLTVLEAIGLGLAVAGVSGPARWAIWRRRHPVITPAQYITDLRRNAHWN